MSEIDKEIQNASEEQASERTPREIESREASQRIQSWENPSNLPTPTEQDGWVFRYIRTSLLGQLIILMCPES